ncbi:MAG: hypothetical protein H7232_16635 [Aeromicrobium sp.]|nr:hypothetical protein [Burkholderiales bacterium]
MKPTLGNLLLFFAFAFIAIMSKNFVLSPLAVVVVVSGLFMLWRPNSSPILLFIFGYQWLQVSTKLFRANLLGLDVDELSQFGGQLSVAIVLSLVGLLCLAMGMRFGVGSARAHDVSALLEDALTRPPLFWLKLYIAALLIATVAQLGARAVPALSQPLLAVATLKWAFYWIFTYIAFARPDGLRELWVIVFFVELALGFGGYFSEFRTTLVITMLALIPSGLKFNVSRIISLAGVCALTLGLGVVWTAIKPEYREFLSQGERAQVVYVTYGDSLAYAASLVGALDNAALAKAANDLAERISYVDFFANAIDHVPAIVPHENGAIWWDALIRPFMPRLFFPDKSVIDDSDRTTEFTGLRVATADEGASVSLGYMAEAYIDLGPYFMMVPIFLLGWGLGKFYRWMSSYPSTRGVLGIGLATATLYPAAQFETSITKLIGGLVVTMLLCWIAARWGAPRFYRRTRRTVPVAIKG